MVERMGQRLTVVQQMQRGESRSDRPLAITITEPSGKIRRASDIFVDNKLDLKAPLLAVEGVRVAIHTPSGHPIRIKRLTGMTPIDIDHLADDIDRVMALSASRAPEFPIPQMIRMEPGTFPVKGTQLYGDRASATDKVTISKPFGIGKYEVTVAEFRVFAQAKSYEITGQGADELKALLEDTTKDDHPVVFVNRDQDVAAYVKWLCEKTGRRFRLPTAAEREYVARGPQGRVFPWGNEWDPTKLNVNTNRTSPVDAHSGGATQTSVEDLSGNVWEWTRTWSGLYDLADTIDPHGPETGYYAEVRGGSGWRYNQTYFTGAYRHSYPPGYRSGVVGLRLAEDLE